ncbi:MAG: bifunctional (p)ppGpp synthetase/guanosine-3',5'-bis(diphosphate) 3'-pyrophosphohydrolase [SAR202 cluster bacterium]|nr:MAG: bifunctional (p)ppGpp synthetase/guanosine-3',5'-bis(diphosphate) 3'-pyrophosphohydrolase [SAR202 cluster bacterium]KAA1298850.1 MAG: bifunctional (p)ppGpp synthetase/guanosine-3',5'-bis(diphosphate) 3'-pyrophosphohydrolase [SAR202 cluster bacterium]|tara:strand:- start:871 stop:3024 length:2154 start_codon:yes stop_codon:yes gene_type:complete
MYTDNLINKIESYLPNEEVSKIIGAFEFAKDAHEGQKRKSGHDFIVHPVEVATHLARLELDPTVIISGLLHDVIEDTKINAKDIQNEFGKEISEIVTALTKLTNDENNLIQNVDQKNMRRFLVSMAKDVRVIIIKLADRLHNVETLEYLDLDKRKKIAKETLSIHAPLAQKIGMNDLKWRLEDESFKHLMPDKFKMTKRLISQKREEREITTQKMINQINNHLDMFNIKAEVTGRPKNLYSVYNKLQRYKQLGRNFSDIEDLIAIRVVVKRKEDCYIVLGKIHDLWRPIAGSFDDYIASPKENYYQSLHTVVMNESNQKIEFQIRSEKMHNFAEQGVASHWKYKDSIEESKSENFSKDTYWLKDMMDFENEIIEDSEYLESVNNDILSDKVIVYSPKNDIFTLPIGSTPLDYAYSLHTDLGHSCQASFINGALKPLNTKLNNGDTVQIQKSEDLSGPELDWLNDSLGYLRTANAKNKVKAWFKKRERNENIERGERQILRTVRLSNIEDSEIIMPKIIENDSYENFAYKVGTGEISNQKIIDVINKQQLKETVRKMNLVDEKVEESIEHNPASSVLIMGEDNIEKKIANCCNAVYGDEIVGYKNSSNEIVIHRIMCSRLRNLEHTNRFLPAAWGHSKELAPTTVLIEAYDRVGLIRDITDVVWGEKTNIHSINSQEDDTNGTCKIQLTVYTRDLGQIIRLLGKMESTPGVYKVRRVK